MWRERVSSFADAFWQKVEKGRPDDCWKWLGTHDHQGYPLVTFARKQRRATRVAIEVTGRTIAADEHACHRCGNAWCCNPAHLYAGTAAENNADKVTHGTQLYGEAVHCAKLTAESVRAIREDERPQHLIASDYGIARSNVSLIKSRKTWRHV